jgi:hypothetical protein
MPTFVHAIYRLQFTTLLTSGITVKCFLTIAKERNQLIAVSSQNMFLPLFSRSVPIVSFFSYFSSLSEHEPAQQATEFAEIIGKYNNNYQIISLSHSSVLLPLARVEDVILGPCCPCSLVLSDYLGTEAIIMSSPSTKSSSCKAYYSFIFFLV